VTSYVEVKTGKRSNRSELAKALCTAWKAHGDPASLWQQEVAMDSIGNCPRAPDRRMPYSPKPMPDAGWLPVGA
jgi:hypothetical protein